MMVVVMMMINFMKILKASYSSVPKTYMEDSPWMVTTNDTSERKSLAYVWNSEQGNWKQLREKTLQQNVITKNPEQ
jgi:hypothetical protein